MENINIEDTQQVNTYKDEKTTENETKLSKIAFPKRKFAIIHGYNGHGFSGNQKNPNVRTVEEEMEKTFYNLKMISECNYGVLQKIGWMRASRTDKKVSAIMNVISCKLHKDPTLDEEDMKKLINENLPKDIKVFRMIEMSRTFDSKGDNNNREYHYIIPSFMLEPKENYNSIGKSIDTFVGNYNFRISPEYHDKIKEIARVFRGSKKYHNYTKKLSFSDASSQRHIYELSCIDLIDFEKFQAIKFKIIGQSFLYNQIRKMIGMIVDVCREGRDQSYLENSFLANKVDTPKAPAEGLYLKSIDYSRYNDRKPTKKSSFFLSEQDEKEMEDFRIELVKNINEAEEKEGVFSKWLWKLENTRENTY
jgi:tRNA pseudouridine38-40 synthase